MKGALKILGPLGTSRIQSFSIEIPKSLAGQRVDVVVGSSSGFDEIDGLLDGAPQIESRAEAGELAQPTTRKPRSGLVSSLTVCASEIVDVHLYASRVHAV